MCLEVGGNLENIWSIFNINEWGIWYFSTFETISWWKFSAVSFQAPSEISGLPVVAALFMNPIHWKRFLAHEDFSNSITFKWSSLLFWMRALAAAIATTVLTTPPLRRKAKRKFFTFSSNFPNITGLPHVIVASFFTSDELALFLFQSILILISECSNGTFFEMGKFRFEFPYSCHRTMDCSIFANNKLVPIQKSLIMTSWMIRITDGFTNWEIFHYPKITFLLSWKDRNSMKENEGDFSMQLIFIIQCAIIWILNLNIKSSLLFYIKGLIFTRIFFLELCEWLYLWKLSLAKKTWSWLICKNKSPQNLRILKNAEKQMKIKEFYQNFSTKINLLKRISDNPFAKTNPCKMYFLGLVKKVLSKINLLLVLIFLINEKKK